MEGEDLNNKKRKQEDLEEPKVSANFAVPRNLANQTQLRRSLGDFSKDFAFEVPVNGGDDERPLKKKQSVTLSFSFVNLESPSGNFHLSSGSSSSDDLRIKVLPNANSFQNFQELLQKGLPSPSPLRRSVAKNLHYGAFQTPGLSVENLYDANMLCEHNNLIYMEPKWKVEEAPDDLEKMDCSCDNDSANHAFFALYSAHGGRACADYVHAHLHHNVIRHPLFKLDQERALFEGIMKTEKDYIQYCVQENRDNSIGASLCAILIYGNHVYVANVGDTSAILCRNGHHVRMAYPHTLKNASERERLEKMGAIVKNGKLCHPVWSSEIFNSTVTRSIGDACFKHENFLNGKPSGLIAEPEIAKISLCSDDQFLFMASSEYWDIVTPKETVDFLLQMGNLAPNEACKQLTELAVKRSNDSNINTLFINLHSKQEQ